MTAIPNPEEGGAYGRNASDSWEEIYGYLQQHGKLHGYGVKKVNAGNYRHGKPTRFRINCNRDTPVKSQSYGKRKGQTTKKVGYLWYGVLKAT
ncbi:hypothetical protein DL764_005919 [Monosporascus ibericus]|uniref:FAR1 domain-containing protein n=1 Tax=Monosporascus ibericus TaxID=155417 RepID=A0A4Q4T764_9PEZI|nr:hypothetical protein DL764_005919 [Monosporascus ibericus]